MYPLLTHGAYLKFCHSDGKLTTLGLLVWYYSQTFGFLFELGIFESCRKLVDWIGLSGRPGPKHRGSEITCENFGENEEPQPALTFMNVKPSIFVQRYDRQKASRPVTSEDHPGLANGAE